MSVTTRMGDDGKSRFGGRVVEKDSLLLETMGSMDELVALLGIAIMKNGPEMSKKIERIIAKLRQIMGLISGCGPKEIGLLSEIKYMEGEIKKMDNRAEAIHEFLEAGSRLDEFLNWCRTVARKCERRVVALSKTEKIDSNVLIYFNRLSDYLFMIARKGERE